MGQFTVAKALGPVIRRLEREGFEDCRELPIFIEPLAQMVSPRAQVMRARVKSKQEEWDVHIKRVLPALEGRRSALFARRRAKREFEAIKRAKSLFLTHQQPRVGVLRSLAFYPGEASLILETVPGRSLREVFRIFSGSRMCASEIIGVFETLGQWLRVFQSQFASNEILDVGALRTYFETRLEVLKAKSAGEFCEAQATRILSEFDKLAGDLSYSDQLLAPIHGDLSPGNVLIGDDCKVTVIDFEGAGKGTKAYDLAHMFIFLDCLSDKSLVRRKVFKEAQGAMLRAYNSQLYIDSPLFQLELLRNSLCRHAEAATLRAGWKARVIERAIWRTDRKRLRTLSH